MSSDRCQSVIPSRIPRAAVPYVPHVENARQSCRVTTPLPGGNIRRERRALDATPAAAGRFAPGKRGLPVRHMPQSRARL